MPGTWYTSNRVLLCTCFDFQGTTFFAASFSYYTPHRVSWAELRKDLYKEKLFGELLKCLRGSSLSSLTCYAQLLKRTSATKHLVLHTYLVHDIRVPGTTAVFLGVLYLKAPPFEASTSYENFLSAGLGSSTIYSSLISVCKRIIFALYSSGSDAWYVVWQCLLDNNDPVYFNEKKETNFQT